MPEPVDYSRYCAPVQFPRTLAELTNTSICPACFTPLRSTICTNCRLDVSHPLGAQLADASADAAASLSRRLELIGQIRYERRVPTVVAAPAPPPPVVTEPQPAAAPTPAREPRRSSVQVILLVVGVSLLSIAAIFFLVYAFITYGILWRSVIIAAITVAAFAVASILRRRGLEGTAEGIAVFAVVLVYLDAFAVRANDLFGASNTDPLLYWGSTLLVSSGAFWVWHRLSTLRAASAAFSAALVPGAFLLVAGLELDVDPLTRIFIGFAAAATVGLAFPLAAHAVERTILLTLASTAWVLGFGFAFAVEPDSQWAPAIALGVLAVVAAAYALVPSVAGWRRSAAVASAVAAAASVGAGLIRDGDSATLVLVPAVCAAAIALVLELVGRRLHRPLLVTAAIGAGAVGALAVLPAIVRSIYTVIDTLVTSPWTLAATSRVVIPDATGYAAPLALAIIIAMVFVASLLARVRRRGILAWSLAALLVLAAPLAGVLAAVLAVWLFIASAGVAALLVTRAFRAQLAAVAITAAIFAFALGWSSESTWLVASAVIVALLLVGRRLVAAKAVLLGIAIAVAFAAAAALPQQLDASTVDSLRLVAAVAIAVLLAPLGGLDRRVAFWMSLPVVSVAAVAARMLTPETAAISQFVIALVLGVALVAALTALIVRGGAFAIERIVASAVLTPAVVWVLDSLSRIVGLPAEVVPISAAVLVSATVLIGPLRGWREIGVAIVAVVAVLYTIAAPTDLTWLVLLLAAVTALLVSISRDGLVASSAPRKNLAWIALLLGIASLWVRLASIGTQPVEAYVLPVSGALLVIAVLFWRAKRDASLVVLGALLVGVVPVAVAAASGDLARAVIIAVISAGLAIAGSVLRQPARYVDAAAIAGTVGIVCVTVGRSAFEPNPDSWLAIVLATLTIAAFGQANRGAVRSAASQIAVVVALLIVLVGELGAIDDPHLGSARVIGLILVFSAIHGAARLLNRAPFTAPVAWVAIAFAGVVVIGGLLANTLDTLELGTVPIAVALLVGAARDTRGSWTTLAPGLLVLLLPSLVATIGERPIWRLVGIGVFAIAAIVFGAMRRKQAPFIIGTVVVLIHAIATFVPQIRAAYLALPWWLWAGFGGILLIALAARYEHRIKNLKEAVGRLSSMG